MPNSDKLVERRDKSASSGLISRITNFSKSRSAPEKSISESIPSADSGIFARRKKLGDLLQNKAFRKNLLASPTFIYGKVGFYNVVLEQVFGKKWDKNNKLRVLYSVDELEKAKKETTTPSKTPIILIPVVQDTNKLNELISSAIDSKQAIWLIGYPSIIQKHLLAAFQCFFLCSASRTEIEILQDVIEITKNDVDYLASGQRDRAILTTIHKVSEEANETYRPSVIYIYF